MENMYRPVFDDTLRQQSIYKEYILKSDLEGNLDEIIEFLKQKRLAYGNSKINIEYNGDEYDVYELKTETMEEFFKRKEQFEIDEKNRLIKQQEAEEKLYKALKEKYDKR